MPDKNILPAVALGTLLCLAGGCAARVESKTPVHQVVPDGFKSNAADIEAICSSAGSRLWRHFPNYEVPAYVVTRGHSGPVVGYERNERGAIVVQLDTEGTFWCQYAYQFAHEFCHILCGYDNDYKGNMWFEETICEAAALFALRGMAREWKTDPPYPNWRDYRDSLREYADDLVKNRAGVIEIYAKGLRGFYEAHRQELEKDAGNRELNGAMAIVFLRLFEEDPARWESVRWLNNSPSPEGETFAQYLHKWHDAVPDKHKEFVEKVAGLFGVKVGR